MVKKALILSLLLVTAAIAAETKYYWDFPETAELESTDRMLVYKGQSTAGRDRNILGSKIAQIGKNASFLNLTATRIYASKNLSIGPASFTPALNGEGYLFLSGPYSRTYSLDSAATSYDPAKTWYAGPVDNRYTIGNVTSGYNITSAAGGITTIYNRTDTPALFASSFVITPYIFGEGTGNLRLGSNAANNGYINLGATSAYDEPQSRLGIGTQTPTSKLQVVGLPTYGGATISVANTTAKAAGLTSGAFYKYSTAGSRVVGIVW